MDKKTIRVAQVIGQAVNGGTEAFAMNYYTHIDRNEVQFDFFVESTSKIIDRSKIEALGGKIVIIPSYKNIFKYIRALVKLFKNGHYDIVHSNMNALSVFTLYAAKKAKIKVRIAHSHSTSNKKEKLKSLLKAFLKPLAKVYATTYFACSEMAGRWLFGDKSFDKGLVTIISNAIDVDKYKFNKLTRNDLRAQLATEDSFIIGHIGRFMPQKNHKFLIDVFYDVQFVIPKAKLLLVGEGPLFDDILSEVKRLGIEDKIIFAGVQANAYDYYNAMDLFVLPSLYEGLGIVLIEAQTNGLNCIASNMVPKEASFISNSVEFVPLLKQNWVNLITHSFKENSCVDSRANSYELMQKSNYDINFESIKLLEIYKNLLK